MAHLFWGGGLVAACARCAELIVSEMGEWLPTVKQRGVASDVLHMLLSTPMMLSHESSHACAMQMCVP